MSREPLIKLNVNLNGINLILRALEQLPHHEVDWIINEVVEQTESQLGLPAPTIPKIEPAEERE